MKKILISFFIAFFAIGITNAQQNPVSIQDSLSLPELETLAYHVSVNTTEPPKGSDLFNMGSPANPSGTTIKINSQSMLIDDKPVLPVMGEIHYSRVPENEWRKELLKMKAGGINIVATYVFWIHHEEIEGEYDWSGQRNLRKFVETCNEVGLPIILRIGPWAHGECRNGGFPEWMVNSGIKLRENNPEYLAKVSTWFEALYKQVDGLMWKDGGAVIGIQIENEYRGRWEHLMTLKTMAREIGFHTPLYTRTGWPKLGSPATFGEILPLYGDYADGFWDRTLDDMPGDYSKTFLFRSFRNSTVIATEQLPKQSDQDNPEDFGYPYFTCELGGGMMTSYHRRINIDPMDIYSVALVKVGSGSNLPGYYMYHGGTNPDSKLTTLNEEQATNFTNHNDLPVKTYDFQAPIGEFGQTNPHYFMLKKLHLFLKDFGSELALMPPFFPEQNIADPNNDSLLRWSVRSDGQSGYVFVNNYQRLKQLSDKEGIQFSVDLPDKKLLFPQYPMTVPSGACFFMPFNMKLGRVNLIYSTAQPLARINERESITLVFSENEGIPIEFLFEGKNVMVEYANTKPKASDEKIHFNKLKTGTGVAIRLRDINNILINIIVLDASQSLNFWKGELAGKERLLISDSELIYNKNEIELTAISQNSFGLSVYPDFKSVMKDGKSVSGKKDGFFTKYEVKRQKLDMVNIMVEKIKDAGPLREIKMGARNVAESPKDDAFEDAAVWEVKFPANIDIDRDLFLKFPYIGDVARIYSGNILLTDNFYNGKVFEIGLNRFSPDIYTSPLQIKILPLQKNAPIYLQQKVNPDFTSNNIVELNNLEVYEKEMIRLTIE